MDLVRPSPEHLPSYVDALRRGWSWSTHDETPEQAIARVTADPVRFLALMDDREAAGDPIEMPDGSTVPRLPGLQRWMWDGEFAGLVSLRWQPGTTDLPPTCLGHVGYSVVPWRRRRGYATAALAAALPIAAAEGLAFVEICPDVDNLASRRVVEANAGVLVEQFEKLPVHGGGQGLRFRIDLTHLP